MATQPLCSFSFNNFDFPCLDYILKLLYAQNNRKQAGAKLCQAQSSAKLIASCPLASTSW